MYNYYICKIYYSMKNRTSIENGISNLREMFERSIIYYFIPILIFSFLSNSESLN